MATHPSPIDALRALLPAIEAEREARIDYGAASEQHLAAISALSVAKLRASDALRWVDIQTGPAEKAAR